MSTNSTQDCKSQYNNLFLDSTVKQFLYKLCQANGPPLYTLTPNDARKVLNSLQNPSYPSTEVDVLDTILPIGPGRYQDVRVRIMRPAGINIKTPLPIVMYFHGGGWVLGNMNTHDNLIHQLTIGANIALVFVEYTLSPEAQYPVPILQAYATTKYIIDHAKDYNMDPSKVAVVGDSVGGNMATVVAMLYNNKADVETEAETKVGSETMYPRIDLQLLFYPVTNANFNTNTYNNYADGPWLTKKNMEWFWDNYLPNKRLRTEPTASPLLANTRILKSMPKTLIIVDQHDVLRDEGEAYAKRLQEAGVDVTLTRYDGMIHDFMMLNGLAESSQTQKAIHEAIDFIKTNFK